MQLYGKIILWSKEMKLRKVRNAKCLGITPSPFVSPPNPCEVSLLACGVQCAPPLIISLPFRFSTAFLSYFMFFIQLLLPFPYNSFNLITNITFSFNLYFISICTTEIKQDMITLSDCFQFGSYMEEVGHYLSIFNEHGFNFIRLICNFGYLNK